MQRGAAPLCLVLVSAWPSCRPWQPSPEHGRRQLSQSLVCALCRNARPGSPTTSNDMRACNTSPDHPLVAWAASCRMVPLCPCHDRQNLVRGCQSVSRCDIHTLASGDAAAGSAA